MTTKIKLFLSGQDTYNPNKRISPAMQRAKTFLDTSKDGELFTSRQVCAACNIMVNSISKTSWELPDYQYRVSYGTKYWGKPATVAQLKRETEQHEGHRRSQPAEIRRKKKTLET